jgi:hypothetical protein
VTAALMELADPQPTVPDTAVTLCLRAAGFWRAPSAGQAVFHSRKASCRRYRSEKLEREDDATLARARIEAAAAFRGDAAEVEAVVAHVQRPDRGLLVGPRGSGVPAAADGLSYAAACGR